MHPLQCIRYNANVRLWKCLPVVLAMASAAFLSGQTAAENAGPSMAIVLAGRNANQTAAIGVAIAVRPNGVLLTPYHIIKDARFLQVRLKTGEVFDQVQLLGVDARRDVAAIKVTGTLAALPVRTAAEMRAGAAVSLVSILSNPKTASGDFLVSAGSVAGYRMADEVAGAGSGFRLIQLTAPVPVGSSGGVLLDSVGNALGLITGSQTNGQTSDFAVPIDSVLGLGDAAVTKTFANGSKLPSLVATASISQAKPEVKAEAKPKADRQAILHNMQTIYIDADNAKDFTSAEMKAALERNPGFASLKLRVVDEPKNADAVLVIRHSSGWEFPFELRSPDRATLLLFAASRAYEGKTAVANIAVDFIKMTRSSRK
jgi:S1-C subfamily serine protease